jgi:aryl-alcohol dehydrogenase-like predicted oxidoreductase
MEISHNTDCLLALGTAQFGLNYGATNHAGKPSDAIAEEILLTARDNQIAFLDTATGYGDSEEVIGRLSKVSGEFDLYTKTPNWNGAPPANAVDNVFRTFDTSLQRLGRKHLSGLMIHYAKDLMSARGKDIWQAVKQIQERGNVAKVGISLYPDDPIDELTATFKPDFVQLPLNVLDQRIALTGQLQCLCEAGIEVHVRSVFLQGVLLSSPNELSPGLSSLKSPLNRFIAWCNQSNLAQVEGALNFVRSFKEVSRVIVGVNSKDELEVICKAFGKEMVTSGNWHSLDCPDPGIVDPRYW